jgi:hypothetical protein
MTSLLQFIVFFNGFSNLKISKMTSIKKKPPYQCGQVDLRCQCDWVVNLNLVILTNIVIDKMVIYLTTGPWTI